MKILDKYLLKTFLSTFATVFVILFFIFILQTVWLFIAELAGKDLDFILIMKFLTFSMPRIVPLVLPLSILLASIMTFGSLSENYEFAAMKSAGISLQRAMKSLIVFIILLSFIAFWFANNVIPYSEYKFVNFRRNIAQVKPAMAIAEGQFSDVGAYNIKVEKKTGENGNLLEGITIHKKAQMGSGSNTVIKAKKGELISNEDSNILKLILHDGNYYEDIIPKKFEERKNLPFAKSEFKQYVINIDLSKLNNADMNEELITNTNTMLTVGELNYTIDSLHKNYTKDMSSFADNIYQRTGIVINQREPKAATKPTQLLKNYTNSQKEQLLKVASSSVDATAFSVESYKYEFENKQKNINIHWIALYDKFVIGFACLLMFFIGAPLGAIIRKGGLGLPIVFAILIFIIYHFINTFGKKVAEENGITPLLGCWMSSIILTPFAIILTKRATNDKGVTINFDWFLDLYNKIVPAKNQDQLDSEPIIDLAAYQIVKDNEWETLLNYSDEMLIKIVKNAKQFGYSYDYRIKALKILESRDITQDFLKETNNLVNKEYNKVETLTNQYKAISKIAFITYLISFLFALKWFHVHLLPIIIGLLNIIIFYSSTYKSQQILEEISAMRNKKIDINLYIVVAVGLPFYILFYFYNRNYLKEALSEFNNEV